MSTFEYLFGHFFDRLRAQHQDFIESLLEQVLKAWKRHMAVAPQIARGQIHLAMLCHTHHSLLSIIDVLFQDNPMPLG